jgi:formylglycine-generating enzyme required for sulfatase activity
VGGVLFSSLMLPSAAQQPAARLEPYSEPLPNPLVKIQMVPIPGGTIKIGSRVVTVKPFWMAKTETPWEVYDEFLRSGDPSPAYDQTVFGPDVIARPSKSYILPDLGWGHAGYPVINVSWDSVTMCCRWISSVTKKKYRVPTEAEWEWACRAGNTAPWKPIPKPFLGKVAWYAGNSERLTHPVGKKLANRWGLYDMFGNVGEWATDMAGKPVVCGGTFLDPPALQAPTTRKYWSPKWQETDPQIPKSRWWMSDGKFVGLRVVCEP